MDDGPGRMPEFRRREQLKLKASLERVRAASINLKEKIVNGRAGLARSRSTTEVLETGGNRDVLHGEE